MKSLEVFDDCVIARNGFAEAVESGNYQQAKIWWFACITLLRAIGHVLHKVDSANFTSEKCELLKSSFTNWKSNEPIFRDFIEQERNNVLKEYSMTTEIVSEKQISSLVLSDGSSLELSNGESLEVSVTIENFVKCKGHRQGETPISTLDEALDWWAIQLDKFSYK
jgi:hypothetical protein